MSWMYMYMYTSMTTHGGDQTNFWISRSIGFPDRSFEWLGLHLHTWMYMYMFTSMNACWSTSHFVLDKNCDVHTHVQEDMYRGVPSTIIQYTPLVEHSTSWPHYSGPIQWARGDVGLKPSAAARPQLRACTVILWRKIHWNARHTHTRTLTNGRTHTHTRTYTCGISDYAGNSRRRRYTTHISEVSMPSIYASYLKTPKLWKSAKLDLHVSLSSQWWVGQEWVKS